MAFDRLSETRKRQLRYGAIGALAILLVGGVVLYTRHANDSAATSSASPSGAAPSSSSTAARGSPAASTATGGGQAQALSPDEQPAPTDQQMDKLRRTIAVARQQATDGDFTAAQATLQEAEKALPKRPETEDARREIAALATPEGQLSALLVRARFAVEHGDAAAAEKALAAAEKLKPDAPEIAELRATLQADQAKATRRSSRVDGLLARMREALARNDLAAADSALNEAERIDAQDPGVHRARIELNRAHDRPQQAEQHDGAKR
jgi:hypothetical protein